MKQSYFSNFKLLLPFIALTLFLSGGLNAQCTGYHYMVFESFRSTGLTFTSPTTPTLTTPGIMQNYNQGVVGADAWRGYQLVRNASGYSGTSSLQFNNAAAYLITPKIASATGTINLSFRYRNATAGPSTITVEYCPVGAAPAGYPGGGADPAPTTGWVSLGNASLVLGDGTTYFTTPFTASFTPGASGYYLRIRRNGGTSVPIIDDLAWSSTVASENTQIVLPTQFTPFTPTTCTTIAMPSNGVYLFSDNGGLSDNYSGSQNHTVNFTPFPGQRIQMKFVTAPASPAYPLGQTVNGLGYNPALTPTGSISISNTDNTLTNYTTNSAPTTLYTSTAPGCTGTGTVQFTTTGTTGNGFVMMVSSIDPASCSNVTGLGVTSSAVKYNEIPLTWTGLTGCTAPSSGYDYYVSTSNTPPGAGALTPSNTTTLQAGLAPGGNSTGTTVTGLAGNTIYYIWVRSNCGSTYGTWFAIPTTTVKTVCPPIPVPPVYTIDFEGSLSIPTCTSTNSVSSGVNTLAGNNYFYNSNTNTWFFTSPLTLTPGLIYRVSYKYANNTNGSATTVQAYYGTSDFGVSPAVTTTLLSTVTTSSNTYDTSRSYFSPSGSGPYYIGIKLQSLASGVLKLDDISIDVVPCWPAATPIISGPATPCPQISAVYTLTAPVTPTSNAPDGYTWTAPSGWVITAGQGTTSVTVTTSVLTGNLSVVAHYNSPTCDDSPTVNYAVSSAAIPSQPSAITGVTSICGALTPQTYSVTNVVGVSYAWTAPGWTITAGQGTNSITVTPSASSTTITVTPTNVGLCAGPPRTLNVVVGTVANSGCDTAVPITDTATDTFRCGTKNFWYAFTPPCTGASPTGDYKISLAGTGGDIDLYVYSSCAGAVGGTLLGSGLTASANESVSLNFSTPGPFYIRVFEYAATAGAGGNFTLSVASRSIGTLGAISGFASVSCSSTTITNYSVAAVAGASTYTWTVPAGWVILSGQGTTSITIRTNGSSAGVLSVVPSGACGIGTPATKTVAVGQLTPGSITGDADICDSNNRTYFIAPVTGATSYTWTFPPGWSPLSGSGTTSVVVAPNTNSGNITVTATGICGTSPASTKAVVAALPVVTTGASVCPGTSTTVSAVLSSLGSFNMPDIPSGAPSYIRSTSGFTYTASTNVVYSTQTITVTSAGDYTFTGCDANNKDTFMAIYAGSFIPGTPAVNFLGANDDSNPNASGTCNLDPQLTVTLTPGTYVLVYSPYSVVATTPSLAGISITASPAVQLGLVEWYDSLVSVTPIGTGSPFNPVGFGTYTTVNTEGAHLFYATNQASPACRTPVTVTVYPKPTVTITNSPATICSIAVTTVVVTGTADTYTWTSSVANTLYSNSLATIPYVPGTNTTTVYVKTSSTATITATGTVTATTCFNTANLLLTVGAGGKTWNGGPAWIPAGTPTLTDNVVINANYSGGSFSACTCTINSGATVDFSVGQTLTVIGDLNNGGTLNFASGASLVQVNTPPVGTNPNIGQINYSRATSIRKFDYTYWSSPVEIHTLVNLSPYTLSDKYIWFNSSVGTYNWETVAAPGITNMDIGRGYGVRGPQTYPDLVTPWPTAVSTPWTGTFVGKPNNGDYQINVIKNGANDWNLLGNPYPSAISAIAFITQNSTSFGAGTTLHFWTHHTQLVGLNYLPSDYSTYNYTGSTATINNPSGHAIVPDGTIAAGQGFMVQAVTPGTSPVTFKNSMRIAGGNGNFFRSNTLSGIHSDFNSVESAVTAIENLERNRVWLDLKNTDGLFKQILVGYVQTATNDYDNGFDGEVLEAGDGVGFYSILQDKKLSIQAKALPFVDTDLVPLGFRSNMAGSFEISLSHFDGFFDNQHVYLEDKLLQVIHPLYQSPYTFVTEIGTFESRFVLRYVSEALGVSTPDFNANNVIVAKENSNIHIQTSNIMMKKVQLVDARGRLILEQNNINKDSLSLSNLNFANQVLIVRITSTTGEVISKKIIF